MLIALAQCQTDYGPYFNKIDYEISGVFFSASNLLISKADIIVILSFKYKAVQNWNSARQTMGPSLFDDVIR